MSAKSKLYRLRGFLFAASLLLPLCGLSPVNGQSTAASSPRGTASQAGALEWLDPELERAQARVRELEAEALRGPGVSARVDPSLRYRDYPGDDEPGETSARLTATASIDFGARPTTRMRSLQSLERARRDLELLRLRGVRDALLAHGYLLVAQVQLESAEAALEEARAAHAEEGSAESALELRAAALDLGEAEQALAKAIREAGSYGMPAGAGYESARFALPARADFTESFDYRLLELDLRLAEAALAEARRRPLDDLRLRGQYRTRSARFGAEGGLVNSLPAIDFDVAFPGGTHRWEVELSAQLVLDDTYSELPGLEAALTRAREGLAGFKREFEWEFETTLAAASHAEEALTIAESELELLREESGATDSPERALRTLRSAELRLYRAWIAYVRAVGSLLELTNGDWLLAGN